MTSSAPSSQSKVRIAFIVPRYGQEVVGGAERLAQGFSEAAVLRGWTAEIWTSCAEDLFTWENSLAEGVNQKSGVLIRRFPITAWDKAGHASLTNRLHHNYRLSIGDQYAWLDSGPHSWPLYEHVRIHAADFDWLIVLPYIVPLVNYAAWIAPEKVIFWPCLHDELLAYQEPFRLLMETARGVCFNSPEERTLAMEKLAIRPQNWAVLGAGVTLGTPSSGSRPTQPPFLIYAGRLQHGKNLALLEDYFTRFVEDGHDMRLVVIGEGPYAFRTHPMIEVLGSVSEAQKAALLGSALALCQPSLRESFSLVVMESWLAGRPVLVHADCPVTRGHVERSGGGFYFRTYGEFAATLDYLYHQPKQAVLLGRSGRNYVLGDYTWGAILDRFAAITANWQNVRQ